MTKRKPAETAEVEATVTVEGLPNPFTNVRVEVLNEIGKRFLGESKSPICEHGNFYEGVKVAPIAREVGMSQIQLANFIRGKADLGKKNYERLIAWLNTQKGAETDAQADALAEVAALA